MKMFGIESVSVETFGTESVSVKMFGTESVSVKMFLADHSQAPMEAPVRCTGW